MNIVQLIHFGGLMIRHSANKLSPMGFVFHSSKEPHK